MDINYFQSKFLARASRLLLASPLLALALTGCSLSSYYKKPERKPYYTVSSRQLAPEPVYNRIRYARPPEPLPKVDPFIQAYLEKRSKERPKIYLGLSKATMEDLAKGLSEPYHYQYYVSSKLSKRKVTFNGSGDIDELAGKLEAGNTFKVVVDHANKEVRIIPAETKKVTGAASKNKESGTSGPGKASSSGIS